MKVVFFVSAAACIALTSYYFYMNGKERYQTRNGHVFLPGFIGVIGIVGMLVFHIPLAAIAFSGGPVAVFAVMCCFAWLSSSLTIARLNCRIDYDDTGFTRTNFFGIKKRLSYDDLTGQYQANGETVLYAKDHPVKIDRLAYGKYDFISFAKKQRRIANGGDSLPKIKKYPSDALFRKNVKEPASFIVIYSLMMVLCIIMIVIISVLGFKQTRAEELTYADVTVKDLETVKSDIRITTHETDYYFVLCGNKKLLKDDPELIEKLSESGAAFRFGYKMLGSTGKEYGYVSNVLLQDGTELLSIETADIYGRNDAILVIAFFSGFFVLFLFCMLITVRIGRHPERYSKRIKRLFFKDGYID